MDNSQTGAFTMKTSGSFKVVPSGEGHTLMVAGGRYTFKASGEDTGGAYTLIEMFLPPPPAAPRPISMNGKRNPFISLRAHSSFRWAGKA
jgi:hypothetical protein